MLHELWRKNRTDGWESIGWILLCYRGVLTQPDPYEKIVNKPCREPEDKPDNIRVYIPLDINHNAILRRLDRIIAFYREVNWKNEMDFNEDVSMILSQLEIYDRIWYIRHMPQEGEHSKEGITLVKEFVARLEAIPDGCAEKFPFDMIEELKREYLGEKENTEK